MHACTVAIVILADAAMIVRLDLHFRRQLGAVALETVIVHHPADRAKTS